MKILVSGSTGLVGTALCQSLSHQKHNVVRLVRRPPSDHSEISWNPTQGELNPTALEGFDAVVHLAGENIAGKRWTPSQKKRIRDSRVLGTSLLSNTLTKLDSPPKVLASASAIGYYGNRGNESLVEAAPPGTGFLPEVSLEWEKATEPAQAHGIRVVHLRYGIILSLLGGALEKMLLPFRLGVGGKLGDGSQYMSWIDLDDAVGATLHALDQEALHGPINMVAPQPVTNKEFTKTLGNVLSRPTIFNAPQFALNLALGEMADDLLFASIRVHPKALLDSGYTFRYVHLEQSLRHLLE